MLNCAILMGRLVADPELRTTSSSVQVTSFTLAVERKFVKQGEERQADFIDIVAWRQTADFICRFFRKGSMIAIQGYIQTRTYEDKNGNKRKAVEVVAENASFCGSKTESGTGSGMSTKFDDMPVPPEYGMTSFANGSQADFEDIQNDDDLPF